MKKLIFIFILNISTSKAFLKTYEKRAIVVPESLKEKGFKAEDINFDKFENEESQIKKYVKIGLIGEVIHNIIEENNVEEFENILKFLFPIGRNKDQDIFFHFIKDIIEYKMSIVLSNNKMLELIFKHKLAKDILDSMRAKFNIKYNWNASHYSKTRTELEEQFSKLIEFDKLYSNYSLDKLILEQYQNACLIECKKHLQDIPGLSELVCSYNELTFEYYLKVNTKKEIESNAISSVFAKASPDTSSSSSSINSFSNPTT